MSEEALYHQEGELTRTSPVALSLPKNRQVIEYFAYHADLQDVIVFGCASEAVSYLENLYCEHTEDIQRAFVQSETMRYVLSRQKGTYPYLGIYVSATSGDGGLTAYGSVSQAGFYGTTITHPSLFASYLREQLEILMQTHEVILIVGKSRKLIPVSFLKESILTKIKDFSYLKPLLVLPSLKDIDDRIADGLIQWDELPIKPLAFFTAERVDYSLARLKHYCGTSVEHFQNFVLLTNYQRYVDGFFQYARQMLKESDAYSSWVEPLDHEIFSDEIEMFHQREHHFQMPAYHLKRKDGNGISLINMGVGPSNAKTITDHLAVLRSHCWIILGHCGGLCHTQRLGDYVLANGYMRDDRVLDEELPLHIPIPPVAEIQQAIMQSAANVMNLDSQDMRRHIRSGTVVSTGNRNWELRIRELSRLLNLGRALAVDMESATMAANAFRFSIPYGTLLCVSDRPLHGELKLYDQARLFYQKRVQQHLLIGVKTMERLRDVSPAQLHSRKLRGFQGMPFR